MKVEGAEDERDLEDEHYQYAPSILVASKMMMWPFCSFLSPAHPNSTLLLEFLAERSDIEDHGTSGDSVFTKRAACASVADDTDAPSTKRC